MCTLPCPASSNLKAWHQQQYIDNRASAGLFDHLAVNDGDRRWDSEIAVSNAMRKAQSAHPHNHLCNPATAALTSCLAPEKRDQ
jgi:hypothetical protein